MELEVFQSLDNFFSNNPHLTSLKSTFDKVRHLGVTLFDRNSLPYHFTASAWIVDLERKYTLLIFHKKLQIWIQPGGHADGEINLAKVAFQEASEETGLKTLNLINGEIFDFDITPIPAHKQTGSHAHLDVRYLIEADINEKIVESDETAGAKWISLDAIPNISQDTGIIRMSKINIQAL